MKILRARLIKRPARNRFLDAFTELSAYFAGLPLLPKRFTNTFLQTLYTGQFRMSACARAVRLSRELCHRVESAAPGDYGNLARKLVRGVWTSDKKPIPAGGRAIPPHSCGHVSFCSDHHRGCTHSTAVAGHHQEYLGGVTV